jgi:hypothetical protein
MPPGPCSAGCYAAGGVYNPSVSDPQHISTGLSTIETTSFVKFTIVLIKEYAILLLLSRDGQHGRSIHSPGERFQELSGCK